MTHLLLKSVLLLTVLVTFSSPALANDWWFDVEVLLYKQDQSLERLEENFPQPARVETGDSTDLLSSFLRPDIRALRNNLTRCEENESTTEHFPNSPLQITTPGIDLILDEIKALKQQAEQSAVIPRTVNGVDAGAQIVGKLSASEQPTKNTLAYRFNPNRWLRSDCVFAKEQRWLKDILAPDQESKPLISSVPDVIDEIERRFNNQPYLLPASQMTLKSIARDLHRQRGIRPLLHLVWRQPVLFGRDKAQKYRLFGGTNFALSYDNLGNPLESETELESVPALASQSQDKNLIMQVEEALSQPLVLAEQDIETTPQGSKTNALWELDGWFKVYLEYINRVPYLHIDSELLYRAEGPPGLMQSHSLAGESQYMGDTRSSTDSGGRSHLYALPFKQLRRVISTQIHYFDHPMFGMVVQIRRFHKPDPPTEELQAE
ncbi:CsiV family protein [Lacimicrobium alkaliphilum]|uniref:Peptidoglycan-binding protein CsiV n=1 Tax=Lacimicrobium alkaliphilum TaxID=1526571 RepID=A0ABQ1R223_9ALTE|nr:CsiV family protein [Lacimicrobium alkaliphilum]GGD55464.1 hypothetical protein GCM10011357_08880 [Lacimicrobium alkaliphilum]